VSDELDVLRPPVRVGEPADGRGAGDHPPIDARAIITAPQRRVPDHPPAQPLRPPDPLGVLDPHDHVVTPADPPARRSRWLLGAAAVVVALIAVGVAVVAGTRDDDPDAGGVVAGATAAVSAPVPATAPSVLTAPSLATAPSPATAPAPTPAVTLAPGRSAVGEPGCSAAACRFLDATLAGFAPGSVVTVTCHAASAGAFASHPVTIGADGTATDSSCYFGHPGAEVWVEADGVTSPRIVWPP
jgi:hypothetical protein